MCFRIVESNGGTLAFPQPRIKLRLPTFWIQ
jgi:hypothetical protein